MPGVGPATNTMVEVPIDRTQTQPRQPFQDLTQAQGTLAAADGQGDDITFTAAPDAPEPPRRSGNILYNFFSRLFGSGSAHANANRQIEIADVPTNMMRTGAALQAPDDDSQDLLTPIADQDVNPLRTGRGLEDLQAETGGVLPGVDNQGPVELDFSQVVNVADEDINPVVPANPVTPTVSTDSTYSLSVVSQTSSTGAVILDEPAQRPAPRDQYKLNDPRFNGRN